MILKCTPKRGLSSVILPSPHSLPMPARSCMKFNMFRFPAQPQVGRRTARVALFLRDCRHCPRVGSVTRVIRSVRKEKEREREREGERAAAMMTTETERAHDRDSACLTLVARKPRVKPRKGALYSAIHPLVCHVTLCFSVRVVRAWSGSG